MGEPLITFDLRRRRIFVGDGEELAKLLKLSSGAGEVESAPSNDELTAPAGGHANGHGASIRDFARRFARRKLYERIAILMHYARRNDNRSTVTVRELSDWFGLCGFKTPARMDKALDNLMRQRRMVERTGPGQWSLTSAGESVALDVLEASVPDSSQ